MVFSYAESLRYHWPVRGPDLCTLLILISVLKKAKCSRSRRLEKSQSSLSDAFAIMKRMNSSEVKWSEVAQSCPTLCNPMDYSLPGSSVHGIFQARVLEWVAISFTRGYSWPRDRTWVSHIVGRRNVYGLPKKNSKNIERKSKKELQPIWTAIFNDYSSWKLYSILSL